MQDCILNYSFRKYYLSFFSIILVFTTINAQKPDYREVFGRDWEEAVKLLEENNHWIKPALDAYKIPYAEAVAVIFPELVRYSALRDRMETGVLKALYVNLGHEYANFSVGLFQVKPLFAEMIREEARPEIGNRAKDILGPKQSYKDERDYRSSIVADLEDPQKEFSYIIAFYLLCKKRFRELPETDTLRIKFLASAYNAGFWKSKDEIDLMADKKFYSSKLISKENYSYADVSIFWYKNYTGKNR